MDSDCSKQYSLPKVDDRGYNLVNSLVAGNDLILDRVFSFLNFEELKICRLVNSKWMQISQSHFNELSAAVLHYHRAEEFLIGFQDSPLKVSFTGLMICFENRLSFNWENGPIIDILKKYGNQLKYIKLKVVDGLIANTSLVFFGFKRILAEFVPGLVQLSVDIHIAAYEGLSLSSIEYKSLEAAGDIKLLKLTILEWSTLPDDLWDYTAARILQKVLTPPFLDLLKSSPNLKSIFTEGSTLNSEAFDDLTKEQLSRVKEISVCPRKSLHQLHMFLNKLTELSQNKHLRLSTFKILACGVEEPWPLWKESFFVSLIKFLSTQKESLQNLVFLVPMCDSPFKYDFLPQFPKMIILENLQMNCSLNFLKIILGNSRKDWNSIFPNLTRLQFSYDYLYGDLDLRVIFKNTVNKTVKFVRLNKKSIEPTINKGEEIVTGYDLNTARDNFCIIKMTFPNLLVFQLFDDRLGIFHLFHFSKRNFDYRSLYY